VYDGEVIPLKKGETLHVNAMRIGYKHALIDYVRE
jgi:N-sulfoglucosamine sulfohydrolase